MKVLLHIYIYILKTDVNPVWDHEKITRYKFKDIYKYKYIYILKLLPCSELSFMVPNWVHISFQNIYIYIYICKRTLIYQIDMPYEQYLFCWISYKIRDMVEEWQSRITCQMVNEVSRMKNTVKAKLKVASQEEWIHLWKHFENLLEKLPKVRDKPITKIVCNPLDIKLRQFTLEELKNKKAAGLDEIFPEVWKIREFDDTLLQPCNAIYNQNTIDIWTKGCILPFSKKDDLGIAKNYWGITLTSIGAKIYNDLLHNCIEPKIEKILKKNQNGFGRNRSTTS